ncbi:MAG: LamG domain-containing protein, partial [Sediminibacterium sp.]|nr:LamG domain-containing protein [Sediminibacterium sp.]
YNALTGGSLYTTPFNFKLKNDSNYYVTVTQNTDRFVCESYPRIAIKAKVYIPPTKPNAPTIVRAGQNAVNISITPKSLINTDSATSYVIISNPAGVRDSVYSQADIAALISTKGKVVTGLTNKVSYKFTVRALNSAGDSTSNSSTSSIIPNNDSIKNYMSTSFKSSSVTIGNSANGDYIMLPSTLILDANYTIETWFKLASNSALNFTRIFNFGNDYLLLCLFNTSRQLAMRVNGNDVPNAFPGTLPTLSADTWYHLSMVVSNNGTLVTLYVNGVAVFSGPTPGTPINSYISDNYIGRTFANQSTTAGQFEDFRIWKKAKTALEVYQQYNAKLTGVETGLYYWLPLGNMQHERFKSYNILDNTAIPNAATSLQSLGNSNSFISSLTNTSASWYYDNAATPVDRRVFLTHRSYNNGEYTEISTDGGTNWYRSSNLPSTIGALATINSNDEILTFKQTFRNGVIKARIRNSTG